jgi:hypothetical protein
VSLSLISTSPVFLDASSISGDGERTVHFTDNIIEPSNIIVRILELFVDGRFLNESDPSKCIAWDEAASVIAFLQKYQCQHWVHIALATLHRAFRIHNFGSDVLFMAACVADDRETVALLLNSDRKFGTLNEFYSSSPTSDIATRVDVRGFDFKAWRLIPLPYLYAITKAATIVKEVDQKGKRGDIFLKLLENAQTA